MHAGGCWQHVEAFAAFDASRAGLLVSGAGDGPFAEHCNFQHYTDWHVDRSRPKLLPCLEGKHARAVCFIHSCYRDTVTFILFCIVTRHLLHSEDACKPKLVCTFDTADFCALVFSCCTTRCDCCITPCVMILLSFVKHYSFSSPKAASERRALPSEPVWHCHRAGCGEMLSLVAFCWFAHVLE